MSEDRARGAEADGRRGSGPDAGAAPDGGGPGAAWLPLPAVVPLLSLLSLLAACASGAGRPAAERPEPVPYADTLPIEEPAIHEYGETETLMKEAVRDEVGWNLSPSRAISGVGAALNVTALDGVVPSAWFEHRIGRREMTPEEVAGGPPGRGPDTSAPLTVVDGKVGGVTPGFTVRDRKGDTYLIKLDPPGHLGLASGADVVSSRIFWAAGYHVPKDVIVEFDPTELVVGEEATVEDASGDERPMRREDVLEILSWTDSLPDGRYRVFASKIVEGTPKGPFRFEGTRDDDPNDHYPHEDRRELRGVWVLAAWIDHVDLRVTNTLDVWVDPPGYLKHYIIDFGATLGSRSLRVAVPRDGREYGFDLWPSLARMVTLGAYTVGWEGEDGDPVHPSLGWIATDSFEPGEWKPFWPVDAYRKRTVRDAYWGAKLVGAFERDHLEAMVEEARYPDPAAADTLVDILQLRQRKVLRHFYGRVTPVEKLEVRAADSLRVSFDDLGLAEGLWTADETRYRWRIEAGDGRALAGWADARPGDRQALRIPLPGVGAEPGASADDVGRALALEITARRPGAGDRAAVATILRRDAGYRVVRLRH